MRVTRQGTSGWGRIALRLAVAAVVVTAPAVVAACGGSTASPAAPATVTATAQPASPSPSAAASVSSTASPGSTPTTTLSVYFLRPIGGAQPSHGPFIATAHRLVAATKAPAGAAVRALLAGPTAREKAIGMTTAIPAGTTLRRLAISAGVATVDLSGSFAQATPATRAAAQLCYTLTQFPTVGRGVVIKVNGAAFAVDGSGSARKRADYESVTPPIFVESPAPFDVVTSPLKVTGTADVFEATFQSRLLDSAARRLAGGTVTATSGSGTRGTFSFSLSLAGSAATGRLVCFDASAENGASLHTVSIPLTFGH
jgi:germination protein M